MVDTSEQKNTTDNGETLLPLTNLAQPRIQLLSNDNQKIQDVTCKLYKIRWFMLYLFCISYASSVMQWTQYSVIANVVVDYYGVSYEAVDWTAMIYLLMYLIFIFPAMYILDKTGLKVSIVLAMLGTTIGAWVKVGSVAPDRFWVVMLGQILVASSQVFMLSFPAPFASAWFGPREVSTACSVGVIGGLVGMALGFVLPPIIVKGDEDKGPQFYIMSVGVALINTFILVIVFIFFKSKPPTPPSLAKLKSDREVMDVQKFFRLLRRLFKDPSYVILLICFGVNPGIFYAISTLLNQILLKHHSSAEEDVGRIGLVIILAGMLGCVWSGLALDRFSYFKETTVVVFISNLLVMIVFTFVITKGILVAYIVFAIFGFFMTSLFPLGFEVAAEITYPEPEGTTTGLVATSSQIFGIIFTYLYSYLFYNVHELWANISMCVLLFISALLIILMPFNLRRQRAQRKIRRADI